MAEAPYNTTSIGWEAQQLLRRAGEWVEYRVSQTDLPELPDWSWPDWLRWDLPDIVGQVLFWLVITGLTLWLTWLLYRALEPAIAEWLAQDQKWMRFGRKADDEEVAHSAQHWWQQAQALAKAGNYAEACKALYRATLQQLHEREILRYSTSRTDGEYLQGLAKQLSGKDTSAVTERPVEVVEEKLMVPRPYQLLIGTHERLMFGGAIASAEVFKRCRRAYEEIAKK